MSLLKPNDYKQNLESVDLEKLSQLGIKNILIDIEGTIVPRKTWDVSSAKLGWLEKAKQSGFNLFLLSNTIHKSKTEKISSKLKIPSASLAFKPFTFGIKKAMKLLSARKDTTVIIGDQLFTDIWGGNFAGIHTILVPQITKETKLSRKFMRLLERIFFKPE